MSPPPVAVTHKVVLDPAQIVAFCGCAVITGTTGALITNVRFLVLTGAPGALPVMVIV